MANDLVFLFHFLDLPEFTIVIECQPQFLPLLLRDVCPFRRPGKQPGQAEAVVQVLAGTTIRYRAKLTITITVTITITRGAEENGRGRHWRQMTEDNEIREKRDRKWK